MEASTISRVQRSDIGAVAHALAQAFDDDPVCNFAWPDDGKRLGRSEQSFHGQTRALWARREIYAAFYHRHGFEVLDELPFAVGGPPIFPIRRAPRG